MTVFLVLVVLALVALGAKRWKVHTWLPFLLKANSKKEEAEHGAKLEIVVDKDAAAHSSSTGSKATPASASSRKSLLSKPPRYEGPRSPVGTMEVSIRTALNELRSRQVVKNICSKFEARVAKHAVIPGGDSDDEEACIRAVNDGGDEYLQPEHAQQLRRDERVAIKPAPYIPRRNSNVAAKPNNLNAFLRRYSSNLDRANFAGVEAVSAEEAEVATKPAPLAVERAPEDATATPASRDPALTPLLSDIDLLDIQSPNEELSNQCDSPVRGAMSLRRAEEPADDCDTGVHGDWDVTTAKEQQQAPEECPPEHKIAQPVVRNSVARFQQFQLQIPSNRARTSPATAQ